MLQLIQTRRRERRHAITRRKTPLRQTEAPVSLPRAGGRGATEPAGCGCVDTQVCQSYAYYRHEVAYEVTPVSGTPHWTATTTAKS